MQQKSSPGKELTGHFALVYPGQYIKAADLHDRDVTIIIECVREEHLVMKGGRKDKKACVTMRSLKGVLLERRWVVGKTVLAEIAAATGETKIANWKGKRITLYPTTCRGQEGKMVECIRVRFKASRVAEEPPEDMTAPADEKAFLDEVDGADDEPAEGSAT
jgi:hypothetical protein